MKLSTLLLGAAAFGLLSTSVTLADDYLGGLVKSSKVGDKEILTDAKGMTLYTWDKDSAGSSTCYAGCAVAWPPMWAPAATPVSGDFTLVDRTDATGDHANMKIVAYKGLPLYYWKDDKAAGDITGDGKGGTWHIVVDAN